MCLQQSIETNAFSSAVMFLLFDVNFVITPDFFCMIFSFQGSQVDKYWGDRFPMFVVDLALSSLLLLISTKVSLQFHELTVWMCPTIITGDACVKLYRKVSDLNTILNHTCLWFWVWHAAPANIPTPTPTPPSTTISPWNSPLIHGHHHQHDTVNRNLNLRTELSKDTRCQQWKNVIHIITTELPTMTVKNELTPLPKNIYLLVYVYMFFTYVFVSTFYFLFFTIFEFWMIWYVS